MKKKKIAIICSTDYNDYPTGGMMSFIKDAAPFLSEHFEVDFWGVDKGSSKTTFTSGDNTFNVRFFGSVCTGRRIVPNLVRVVWFLFLNRKLILDEGYHGLYFHGIPLNLAFPGRIPCKRINHVHGLTNPFSMNGLTGISSKLLAYIYAWYRRKVVRQSDLILLAADHVGIKAFCNTHPYGNRVVKIENFCDLEIFGPHTLPIDRVREGISLSTDIFLHVGRFAYQKDPLFAIRIFKSYLDSGKGKMDSILVMIGDGPLLEEGKAIAESLNISNAVRFLGNMSRTDISHWLATADLYLYTSHANGYPISLAEAAQTGLPIVSTDVTGVHDLVVPKRNGALIKTRNPIDFVEGILDVLQNRSTYASQSLEIASDFKSDAILSRLTKEISDVL